MARAVGEPTDRIGVEPALAPEVRSYALRLVLATHPESEFATPKVTRYVRYGASPRGGQAIEAIAAT